MSMRPVRALRRNLKHQGHQEHQEVSVVKCAISNIEIQKTKPILSHLTRNHRALKTSWCSWWPWWFTRISCQEMSGFVRECHGCATHQICKTNPMEHSGTLRSTRRRSRIQSPGIAIPGLSVVQKNPERKQQNFAFSRGFQRFPRRIAHSRRIIRGYPGVPMVCFWGG